MAAVDIFIFLKIRPKCFQEFFFDLASKFIFAVVSSLLSFPIDLDVILVLMVLLLHGQC